MTLVELLVVILLIALLVGGVAVSHLLFIALAIVIVLALFSRSRVR